MPISETELPRSSLDKSSRPKFHHKVSHGKTLANILLSVKFASWVQGNTALGYDSGRQRYVSGDNQVVRCSMIGNVVISSIKAIFDGDRFYKSAMVF